VNNISFGYSVKESLSFDKDDKVIIMFHGYGSNKDDLFSFAKFMNPNFLIISVQAPIQMDYNSYCWWSLNYNNDMQLQMDVKEAENSLNELNRFISEDLSTKYNFGLNQVYLLGFSQGCMISYALSINFPENYKKAVGLSGKIPYEIINFDEKFDYSNHNFFCSHGVNDQVIPIEVGRESNRWFSEKNINHKYLEFESAHGINSENFEQMNLWLLKN
jgi:phospholipase/carboxylesterase|tara:strand:+ start:820 stop:1470 length:651 start_codon:yes stop_codon:yes gene_type:complete